MIGKILVWVWTWIKGVFGYKTKNSKVETWSIKKNYETFETKKLVKLAYTVFSVLSLTVFVLHLTVGTALALDNSSEINWTSIKDMVQGFADIMPAIVDFIVAVIPVIIVLIFVAFFRGTLESVISMIKGGFKFR